MNIAKELMAVITTTLQTYEYITGLDNLITGLFDFSGGLPVGPANGDSWLASVGGSGVTVNFLVAFYAGDFYQCQPNIGSTYQAGVNQYLIDADGSIINLSVVNTNTVAYTTAIGVNTFASWTPVVYGNTGIFAANSFTITNSGVYSITFNSTNSGANALSLEMQSATIGNIAGASSLAIGQPVGCTYAGFLQNGDVITFRYNSSLVVVGLQAHAEIYKLS